MSLLPAIALVAILVFVHEFGLYCSKVVRGSLYGTQYWLWKTFGWF